MGDNSMNEFSFKNLETNAIITIPLDKKYIYIYGGNGMGKTTFSRQFSEENNNSKVFNIDYINRNVYIVDNEGVKIDATTKDNFSKIFVSEKAVEFASEMSKVKEINKEATILQTATVSKINQLLQKYQLESNVNFEKLILKLNTSKLDFNYKESLDNNKNRIILSNSLDTEIKNDNELETKIKQYKANDILLKIHDKITKTESLRELFIDEVFIMNLNIQLSDFNSTVDLIRIIETDFNKSSDPKLFKEWIENGVKLHSGLNVCLFCGNDDIQHSIQHWRDLIENKKSDIKKIILKKIEKAKDDFKLILSSKSIYESIIPLIIKTLEKLLEILDTIEKQIHRNISVVPIELIIDKDLIESNMETQYSDIVHYILNKDLVEFFFPFYYLNYLVNEQNVLESKANSESEKFAKSTNEIIEKIAKKLGLEKELKIFHETRRGSTPKMSIGPADKKTKIGTFSEGQVHKLALAIFFADILSKDKICEFLVLDDPMISLDVVAYHKLKSFIIFDLQDKYEKSIILTHNISFLLIMLSNLFRDVDKREETCLIELKPFNHNILPIEIIAKDDIVLFKHAIDNSIDMNDVSLWYWMIEKIARYFLDIKLSLMGIVSFSDVSIDLRRVFKDEDLNQIKLIHKQIVKASKDTKAKVSEIVLALENLNIFCIKLGFPEIITDVSLVAFKTKFYGELIVIQNPTAKDLEFLILKEGHTIVFNPSRENAFLKDYIMHPRHQVTESLVAFEAQLDR